MVRVTLDGRVEHCIKLLNSSQKCNFLAYFPEEGVTLTDLASAELFSPNKSVIHYHLKPYRSSFDSKKKEGSCFKTMILNEYGQDLQKIELMAKLAK